MEGNQIIRTHKVGRVENTLSITHTSATTDTFYVRVEHKGHVDEQPYDNEKEAYAAWEGVNYGLRLGHKIAQALASDLLSEFTDTKPYTKHACPHCKD
jgi:hypothetical protein